MRIGYVTPNSWGLDAPQQVIDLAVRAEELGADSLWVSHHVLHRGFIGERLGQRPYHDPLTMLAAFATTTRRARLGTSVLVVPYLHPMSTAKALATLDHLSQGRIDVGVGVGGLRVEHDPIGQVPWEQRGAYGDELLSVMRLLWSGEPGTFSGRHFRFEDVEAHPGPYRPGGLPLLVGGTGEAAFRRAARLGDGWHGIGLEPEQVPAQRDALRAAFAKQDRSLDGLPFQLRLHIPVEDVDVDSWRARRDRYAAAGVTELVLAPQSGDIPSNERWLDTLVPALVRQP